MRTSPADFQVYIVATPYFFESADFSGEEYCIGDVLITEEKFGIPFIDGRGFPRV
jgi:hypothetical protein